MSLRSRIFKLEKTVKQITGGDLIAPVFWKLDNKGIHYYCSHQKKRCPEMPCNQKGCWLYQKYPNGDFLLYLDSLGTPDDD